MCSRDDGDYYCEDPFADVTLIPDSTDSEVFVEPSFVNYFKRPTGRTVPSYSCQWRNDECRSDGLSVSPVSSVSQTSESCLENVSFRSEESNLPGTFAKKTLLRPRRQLLSLDSRRSGRSQSVIFAALGSRMPDPKTEEPQVFQCGNRTHVGNAEIDTKSVTDKSTSEGIQRCGVAACGCSKELDARSGPEAGWSTVLRNCEKNIPLSSLVPYIQRLSMLPDHMASHPLDILTDPDRKAKDTDCHLNCSETFSVQDHPDAEAHSESTGLPAKPLLRMRLSSDSETIKSGSRTSSETNLQSFHERISIVDLMPPGFENAKCPSDKQSKEGHGLMSTQFLPKRPLSQICSRTINSSHIWKMGNTSAEGLPHCHATNSTCGAAAGNPWKSVCNISEQIQAARYWSRRGFGSLLTNGMDKHEQLPFPGPSDFSSTGSSGLASFSQVSSSLETSPTHKVLSGAANTTQMENGVRSRLSSFDRDCKWGPLVVQLNVGDSSETYCNGINCSEM